MWRGVTDVSLLRDDLTFIVSVSLRIKMIYFLKLTPPRYYFSHILSFSKLLPENLRTYADLRNSKNIQGLVNTLDILESS